MSKDSKRRRLEKNKRDGKAAEDAFREDARFFGKEIKRTGKGHDFKETIRDPLTGKVTGSKYHEIKHGGGELSQRQKQARARHGDRYEVQKYDEGLLGTTRVSTEKGNPGKKKRRRPWEL